MKYCSECGKELKTGVKFCTNCGHKVENKTASKKDKKKLTNEANIPHRGQPKIKDKEFSAINKSIDLKNNQGVLTRRAKYVALFFGLIIMLAWLEIITIHPAAIMLSIFFMVCAIIIAFMFKRREEKLQTLITGENLLAQWTLSAEQKKKYIDYQFQQQAGINIGILIVVSVISIIVFGLFILFIDEGRLFMFFVLLGLIAFLSIFAFGMPYYYKRSNKKGDGKILIGAKYAYVNGYFHNWDYPMSGLNKIKVIKKPFYGIYLVYFYTDRTYEHSQELYIPANEDIDLKGLVQRLQDLN